MTRTTNHVPASSKLGRQLLNTGGYYHSKYIPHQGEKQDAKPFKETTARNGFTTIGPMSSKEKAEYYA